MGCGARAGAGTSVFLAVISAASAGREATEEDFASSTENEGSSRHLILVAGPDFAGCNGTGSILLSFLSFSIPLAAVDSWAPLILALELVTYPELSEFSDLVETAAGAGLGLGPETPWCNLILYL